MKIGVTGYKGRIGSELVKLGGIPLECDITDIPSIMLACSSVKPDVVVHCAGISSVDECQKDFNKTYEVNVRGISNVKGSCKGFIFLSSDHIFNGKKGNYSEKDNYIKDITNKSVYALSKIGAELVTELFGGKIIRLSTVFGKELIMDNYDINGWPRMTFPTFIQRSYGYVNHIAKGIWFAANNYDKIPNILNIAGTEILSMYEFYLMYATVFGLDKNSIHPRNKPEKSYVNRPFKTGLNVKLARKLGVPLYSAYEGLVQLKEDLQ